jgi:arginyl-tRNA synthetase
MPRPLHPFHDQAITVVAQLLGVAPDRFEVAAPPSPELGDFGVGCFPAARTLHKPPQALAAEVAAAFRPTERLASAQAAGPFVNFRARPEALYGHLFAATRSGGSLIPTTPGAERTICIDFSSPNIAKQLSYHHIRGTMLGHALVQMYRALGYSVVGINHLGDWGTTHGMLLAARELWGEPEPLTIAALNDQYVRYRAAMKEDPSLDERGRAWFKRLEDGDPDARAAWQRFRDVSLDEFNEVYGLLGIQFDEVRGESEFEHDIPKVMALLEQHGLVQESDGALVVELADQEMPPLLLRKQDGATLYATRDLAAALYRHERYRFARSLYVVDRGQALHFKQLFATLEKAGCSWATRCEHVQFGVVRIGGKKTGTRSGTATPLRVVLEEAQARVAERLRGAGAELSEADLQKVARSVGIGAVIFANLVSQRERDVDFSLEDITSLEGDAGPYVQYAHARCSAVLRRAGSPQLGEVDASLLVQPAEWALALRLLELPDAVARAVEKSDVHVVAHYLLDLCSAFSRFYTAGNGNRELRVLCEDERLRDARLALVAATRTVLRTALGLLGIEAPDRM